MVQELQMNSIDRANIGNMSLDPSSSVREKDQERTSQLVRSAPTRDSIELSSLAKEGARISNLVEQSRLKRVAEVRQMVDSGKHHVSAEHIARRLIETNWKTDQF